MRVEHVTRVARVRACGWDCDLTVTHRESLPETNRTASRREAHPPDSAHSSLLYNPPRASKAVFALTHMPPPAVIMAFSPPHSYHTSSPSKRAHIIIGPSVHTRYLGSISSERHAASGISLDAKCSG